MRRGKKVVTQMFLINDWQEDVVVKSALWGCVRAEMAQSVKRKRLAWQSEGGDGIRSCS